MKKILSTIALLALSNQTFAFDNNLMFQLQNNYNQQQIIREMQAQRWEQERQNEMMRQEYNRLRREQNNNNMFEIIANPRPPCVRTPYNACY